MKVIKQSVYRAEYSAGCSNYSLLVEADSIIEAMEVAKSYLTSLKDRDIKGVQYYNSVIKKLTKTVTVEL